MVVDKRSASFAGLRGACLLPIAPIQYAVNLPTSLIDHFKNIISSHQTLVKENAKLKANQLILRTRLQLSMAIESENNYLKALLKSSAEVKSKSLMAELLAVTFEPFVKQVLLNKGMRDGVYQGQPVLDASGVMGQIIQAGPITSRALLISDPHSGVAVQNSRNGMRAMAVGDSYTGKLRLLYVSQTADIQNGDLFVTSGLGDHYPEGYPVGKVILVSKDPAHQFARVYLDPIAHLNSSRQVLLIWYQAHA